ncbi:4-hydroxy-3-polyprenylbenzoate decarboxylase [Silvibacterium bohemicum]|uniref:4-hydroxy-3-polyprenylbenzoate decarboxylase n=1 Tax=Silvibacterium bohemicum TaxID=1577686 RepID=A0A841JZ68_9BACT|nr:UbiD family decarboxylase [Silvibacterium bohemicum]MBB6146773.1 4-hydroxy-3-polyprenylbenzoate decarboxylase [Silvibacterium bohemicum]
MPQQSLSEYVDALEKAGLLKRIKEEKRVDELPRIMEDNPDVAVLVEKVKDSQFPFFANGYGVRPMYALALECDYKDVGIEIAKRSALREKPQLVDKAPVKDVILKGDDIDLTIFPLFHHHPGDGHAYLNDTNVVTRNPDTGLIDQGIYRFMYRSKNQTNIDMRNDTHGARINAKRYRELGKDMPIAVIIGGPTLDKIASMVSFPGVDDWDILGGFYGESAKLVKCETNDLTVPANAEIVIEGRVITTEGWIHDEGPYGEYTGTYGGGLPHNNRFEVDCITYRKGAIYQYATIGGLHPGRTDMYAFQPAIEGDLYLAMQRAGILVQNVYLPYAGCSNIAYASIKTRGGGDAKQALALMLAGSRQWMPKVAYVFDHDVDIYNDERVKWAQAWRFNPAKGTMILPDQNMLPLDPSLGTDHPPVSVSKIGFDCTIPLVGQVDPLAYAAATVSDPIDQPTNVKVLGEAEVVKEMEALIREKPRTWRELTTHFAGQPYPILYRAFGQLRPKLGRMADLRPDYPYTFAETNFVYGNGQK